MKKVLTIFLFFVITFSFSQEVKKRQITSKQVDAIFSKWNTTNKPGIAVGVLNDGKLVYAKGFGLANLEHQIPITSTTKFHIGDIAKEFTVYALLLLEKQGKLSLQDDIKKHLPQLPFPNSVTIQQLIHHTSGLNNDEVFKALAGWNQEDIFTKKQAYTLIENQLKNTSNNNTEQIVSDAGFMILEDLITKISKMQYEDFVTKEIFKPLGMKNSKFDINGNVITNKAQGYFAQNENFVNSTINYKHTILSDVYTTVEDMCLWAKELNNPKIGTKQIMKKFDGLSIVNDKKLEETNQALYTGGHRFWNFRGSKKLHHIEVAGGYASKLIRYPDYDLAVIVLGNDGAYNGSAATAASELYIEDFLNSVDNQQTTKINSKKLSKKQLSVFEGNYWDINSYTTRKIYVANDTLRYYRGRVNESALVPLTNNSFKMITWGDVKVNFDVKNTSKSMTVMVGEQTFYLKAYDENADWTKNLDVFTGNYYSKSLNTSYSLSIKKNKLILTHHRIEPIELTSKIKDVFAGNRRYFSSIKFNRDSNGIVEGFTLSTNGVNNINFKKESNRLITAK